MDRRIVNFLVAQFSPADLVAAVNALLNPRTKRASTRTPRKARKVARRKAGKAEASAE